MDSTIDQLVDAAERLGVIGSPSATSELTVDILGAAVERKLVGELALFRFTQDAASHYALGQITEVKLKNIWHEDATMRSLIRQRGRIDAVSERQDTHLAQMGISAVFRAGTRVAYEPSILGTVPATGTSIHVINDEILARLLSPYRDQIFYLGHVYGSAPRLPLWFKHFDTGPDGAGEAHHLGVFGKTGSGKSVLAKMILLAYARYPQMALLVLDPQGEFARDMRDRGPRREGEFSMPLRDLLRQQGKEVGILTVRKLILDRWDLFEKILCESQFLERLSMSRGENRDLAASILAEQLKKKSIKLADLHSREAFDAAWRILGEEKHQRNFYRSDTARARFAAALADAVPDDVYTDHWKPVAELFRTDRPGTRTVEQALSGLLNPERAVRPVLVVDLSRETAEGLFWNDTIQSLVMRRLLDGLITTAERFYKEERSLNTLVVIDEAHRLAPKELGDDDVGKLVRSTLIDAARTTRKQGLGWMFISQTLASLHNEILQQLRIYFFGFGLGLGQEFQSLRQLVGGAGRALELYQLFRDPHSAFDVASRQYSFMTIGPVSPLSFSGSPLFLNAFNTLESFLGANGLSHPTTPTSSDLARAPGRVPTA